MDIPPEWDEDWTRTSCSGDRRDCRDEACVEKAEKDGYVNVGHFSFCPRDQVTHPLGNTSYLAIGAAVLLLVAAVFTWLLIRRRRITRRWSTGS